MKKLFIYPLLLLFFFGFSCKKESKDYQGYTQFEFSSTSLKSALKSAGDSTQMAGIVAVAVTIEDNTGNVIKNMEKIELFCMNGNYISKPLPLTPGKYSLTNFLVLDKDDNIIYVSPIKGSAKAYLVQNPLPLAFTLQTNEVTKITPSVLAVGDSKPEDFGYGTFGFNVAKTFDFLIGVFIYDPIAQNFDLTTATISISSGTTNIYNGQLTSTYTTGQYDSTGVTNKITLPEIYNSFTLIISKQGYKTYSKTFTKEELRLYYSSLDKGPLVVVLDKNSNNEQLNLSCTESAAIEEWSVDPDHYDNANMGSYNGFLAKAWTSGGTPFIIRSLIRFDLSQIPAGKTIVSAVLHLYSGVETSQGSGHESLTHPNDFYLKRITSNWTESEVTWNTQPTTTNSNQVHVAKTSTPLEDFDIDVTNLINDMKTNNNGMMIQVNDETPYAMVIFGSDDAPEGKRPTLTIEYH